MFNVRNVTSDAMDATTIANIGSAVVLDYEVGFYADMSIVVLALFGTAAIAAVLNAFLLYITVKNRSLHNTYNHLLAITAVCDCLHCVSYSVSVYHSLIGKNMVLILSCFYMQIYTVPAWTMSCVLLLLVAIDGLTAILFPIWHRNVNNPIYLSVLNLPGVLFSVYIFVVAWRYALMHTNTKVICMYSACLLDYVGVTMFRASGVIGALTLVCYLIIWIVMRRTKTTNLRRTVKSLVAIMVCVLVSWGFNAALEIWVPQKGAWDTTKWFITRLGAFAINIASGSNVVFLYYFSSDYNKAIVKELKGIVSLAGRNVHSSVSHVAASATNRVAGRGSIVSYRTAAITR